MLPQARRATAHEVEASATPLLEAAFLVVANTASELTAAEFTEALSRGSRERGHAKAAAASSRRTNA